MPSCPKCQQKIAPRDLSCPHCRAPLKAHGHPGMTIHYAQGDPSLCLTCALDADNSCTLAKRPEARDCTLYLDQAALAAEMNAQPYRPRGALLRRYQAWIVLGGIVAIAFIVTLLRS